MLRVIACFPECASLVIFAPVLLAVMLVRRVVTKRARLRQSAGASISVVVVTLLSTTPALSQDKQRVVQWPEIPFHANAASGVRSTIVPQIEILEIVDVTIGGKPVTLGEAFTADAPALVHVMEAASGRSMTGAYRRRPFGRVRSRGTIGQPVCDLCIVPGDRHAAEPAGTER